MERLNEVALPILAREDAKMRKCADCRGVRLLARTTRKSVWYEVLHGWPTLKASDKALSERVTAKERARDCA
jgi:hypothetical protein